MTKGLPVVDLLRHPENLLLAVVFLAGCSTAPLPEQTRPAVASPNTFPASTVQSETAPAPAPPETGSQEEQATVAGIDEKLNIFFSLGSSTINRAEKAKLQEIAGLLKNDKSVYVTLVGHANDNGSSSFNLAVAGSRVESVGKMLKGLGVTPLQIRKKLMGGENIPRSCRSTECRKMMRRVELIISDKEQ